MLLICSIDLLNVLSEPKNLIPIITVLQKIWSAVKQNNIIDIVHTKREAYCEVKYRADGCIVYNRL